MSYWPYWLYNWYWYILIDSCIHSENIYGTLSDHINCAGPLRPPKFTWQLDFPIKKQRLKKHNPNTQPSLSKKILIIIIKVELWFDKIEIMSYHFEIVLFCWCLWKERRRLIYLYADRFRLRWSLRCAKLNTRSFGRVVLITIRMHGYMFWARDIILWF